MVSVERAHQAMNARFEAQSKLKGLRYFQQAKVILELHPLASKRSP